MGWKKNENFIGFEKGKRRFLRRKNLGKKERREYEIRALKSWRKKQEEEMMIVHMIWYMKSDNLVYIIRRLYAVVCCGHSTDIMLKRDRQIHNSFYIATCPYSIWKTIYVILHVLAGISCCRFELSRTNGLFGSNEEKWEEIKLRKLMYGFRIKVNSNLSIDFCIFFSSQFFFFKTNGPRLRLDW
jgi:hypothetical protein